MSHKFAALTFLKWCKPNSEITWKLLHVAQTGFSSFLSSAIWFAATERQVIAVY